MTAYLPGPNGELPEHVHMPFIPGQKFVAPCDQYTGAHKVRIMKTVPETYGAYYREKKLEFYTSLLPPPSVLHRMDPAGHPGKMYESERKEYLEQDYWVESVTEHNVVCKGCKKEIALSAVKTYQSSCWLSHRNRCGKIYQQWFENNS